MIQEVYVRSVIYNKLIKGMAAIRHVRTDQCHILCVDDKGNITLMMDSIHTIHFTSRVDDQCGSDLSHAQRSTVKRNVNSLKHVGIVSTDICSSQQLPGMVILKDPDNCKAVIFIKILLPCCNVKISVRRSVKPSPQWKLKFYFCYTGNIKILIAGYII